MRCLFDASSFIKALKLGRPEVLVDNYVQWLTIYEVLNALWREAYLLKPASTDKVLQLVDVVVDVARYMRILGISSLEKEVLRTSMELGLTAYDASYIVLAQRYGLTLVTEDRKLMGKAQRYVNVTPLDTLLSRDPVNG
ncbi:MAG: type II toxin-antitoxin system VapC family toxin [Desulfurococcaceae archaeon]|nr:type II toxin-antitoxin system VapC family toxin [Desulfurococcaceae archaeon]